MVVKLDNPMYLLLLSFLLSWDFWGAFAKSTAICVDFFVRNLQYIHPTRTAQRGKHSNSVLPIWWRRINANSAGVGDRKESLRIFRREVMNERQTWLRLRIGYWIAWITAHKAWLSVSLIVVQFKDEFYTDIKPSLDESSLRSCFVHPQTWRSPVRSK